MSEKVNMSLRQEIEQTGLNSQQADSLVDSYDEQRILKLFEFYRIHNQKGGFFSKADESRIFERHILENMVYVDRARDFVSRETKIADIATGPGLPGSLFGCLQQPLPVTLIDSSRRRLGVLESQGPSEIVSNCDFLYARVEELKAHYSLLTSRAFIPFPQCALAVHHLQKKNDLYLPFLSVVETSDDSRKILKQAGYFLEDVIVLHELSFLGQRSIAVLRKNGIVNKARPYRWKFIKDQIK